jgi:branched-chain amino acid transport system substrate-binding protein
MKTTKITLLILSLIFLLVLICGNIASGDDKSPITIGVLENKDYAYADMMQKSFALALESINDQGGINGRMLRLVYANDSGQKDPGIKAVKSLIKKENIVMLTGGYSSTNTLAMTQTADELDIPFLVCTAADDRITQHKRKNIFRINPPASEYAKGLESLLQETLKPKSMAIVYENSPYGTSSAARMMWFCRQNGIDITAIIPYHKERAAPDYFDRIITVLKTRTPESIYLVSYMQDGVLMVQRIRAANITAHLMGGAGGFTHPEFIAKTGESSKYMMTATLWTADLQYLQARQYAELYQRRYMQTPDYHGAEAYSALVVAADALRRARSADAKDIRDALNQTAMLTPFGPVAFNSYDNYERQNSQPTLVLQVLEGKYACVWPPQLSVAKLILPVTINPVHNGFIEASK